MNRRKSGSVRAWGLCALAVWVALCLSDTAIAKTWTGSHTEKWHEDKWERKTAPTEMEKAFISSYYPIVNVERTGNVAAELLFARSTWEEGIVNLDVNIMEGALLTIGAPGKPARIADYSTSGYSPRIKCAINSIGSGSGVLRFNKASTYAQVDISDYILSLTLGHVEVPDMAGTDGVSQSGPVILQGPIRAIGGAEPWKIDRGSLTVGRAEYIDAAAPDILRLWLDGLDDKGEAVLNITDNVELKNAMLAVGAKGQAVLEVADGKVLTLTKAGQLVNRLNASNAVVVKRGKGALALAGDGIFHGGDPYSDLKVMKVDQGLLHVKGSAFASLSAPVKISVAKGTAVTFERLNEKHDVSLEFSPGAALSLDMTGATATSPALQVAELSGDVTLDLKNTAGISGRVAVIRTDNISGLKSVFLLGAGAEKFDRRIEGNTVFIVGKGGGDPAPDPTPNPEPQPSPGPKPTPKPNPRTDKDKSGGGCDAGLSGTAGLALLLAASLLLRRK